MRKPSVILMGSKPGSVVALEQMLERGWDVHHVVVTQQVVHPWIEGPTLEEFATERGLSVLSQREIPRDKPVDFVISYMFRNLVKLDVIRLARCAALNFHAGPLPEFGGWAFYNVAILEEAIEYGCSCHYMDENFDTGPLLKVRRFPIDASQHTAFSLERAAQQEMVQLFIHFMELAESGQLLPREPQNPSRMRYMNRDEFMSLKQIPSNADAKTIDRYARAFWYPPYECASATINGTRIEIVPEIAKQQLGEFLHGDALQNLRKAARGGIYRVEPRFSKREAA